MAALANAAVRRKTLPPSCDASQLLTMMYIKQQNGAGGVRLADSSDTEFLERLYLSVREPELRAMEWSATAIRAFCDMQLRLRDAAYRSYVPPVETSIIEWMGQPVGRMDVARAPGCWVLAVIELLPAARGQGRGTYALRWLQRQAAQARAAIRLSVDRSNRASPWYVRCGFVPIAHDSDRQQMQWSGNAPMEA